MSELVSVPLNTRLRVYPRRRKHRSARDTFTDWMKYFVHQFRSSIRTRVVVTTFVLGGIVVSLVGLILATQVADRVFSERLEQIITDAQARVSLAQEQINASTAQSAAQVQRVANDLVSSFQNGISGLNGALLMTQPSPTGVNILEPFTGSTISARSLVTPQMRESVQNSDNQYWQSVRIETKESSYPGIVVGTLVNLPLVGAQELYLVYSLEQEQRTVQVVVAVLGIGFMILALLVAVMAFLITRTVIRPVKQVSKAAQELASGSLVVRAPVVGEDELAVLATSFNHMADSLAGQIEQMEELSKIQQRFVSDVSHEIRTPMTTIRMAADLLHAGREQLSPAQARASELLQGQLTRFEAMLTDLLEISRFDSGSAKLNAETNELGKVVASVLMFSEVLAENQKVPLRILKPNGEIWGKFDRVRVERIVRNLVVNAIEHAEKRPVEIAWAGNERVLQVRVSDHGVGISESQAAHVFDRFWRADPARTRTTGGTGIGIAISLEDATLHGGTITVHGMLGVGSVFILTLPLEPHGELDSGPLEAIPADLLEEGNLEAALQNTGEMAPITDEYLTDSEER